MPSLDPGWTAPLVGQDWRDDELMLAVAWLKSLVPSSDIESRIDAAKQNLRDAQAGMRDGIPLPLFDPADKIAWYVLQAQTFATDREFWTPQGVMAAVPFLTRLGKELRTLQGIRGAEERASRLMLAERRQPDGGIYELLVALAYQRGGWCAEFVPETPGRGRTPDIFASRPRSHWAIECKRLAPSTYATQERAFGRALAEPVHKLCLDLYRSVVVDLNFKVELKDVDLNYLAERVASALKDERPSFWDDEISDGFVRPVSWPLAREVMRSDYIYFGGSRMIELLSGHFDHSAEHSLAARWRPASHRPEYADAIYHASVVTWRSGSIWAKLRKAQHFRRVLANAEGQLPGDRPGVIHVGIDSGSSADVSILRHLSNRSEARSFTLNHSRLRWVYANHFEAEETTRRDETWALIETRIPYRVGSHGTQRPLKDHMIVSPDGSGRAGVPWDGRPLD